MGGDDYLQWRNFIHKEIGLYIKESQIDFLERRLWDRMKGLSVDTYQHYYRYVTEKDKSNQEWEQLIEVLVNCQSSFFRHMPTFEALMDKVFPELGRKSLACANPCLSIWSAGCARGQEPYSLAVAFAQVFGEEAEIRVRVTGTDISHRALAKAQKGEYAFSDLRDIHPSLRNRYFTVREMGSNPTSSDDDELRRYKLRYRIKENIRKNVHFSYMNLNDPGSYGVCMQDVIFCQNVLIYFRARERARAIMMLLKYLNPGGYLFLTSAETLGVVVDGAKVVPFKDTLVYKRNQEAVNVQIHE